MHKTMEKSVVDVDVVDVAVVKQLFETENCESIFSINYYTRRKNIFLKSTSIRLQPRLTHNFMLINYI